MARSDRITKTVSVVGARPQFIKAAAVSRAMAENNKRTPARAIVEKLIHTGQHYDDNMSQVFFDELDIQRPDYNLEVGSASHGKQTARMLEKIEAVLIKEKPDWVLVYGDTNSTLAGALAAAKLHIPVAHVEAGLRSFNRTMPEEINRVLTDHISNLLFCPTDTAVENLEAEGILKGVHQVGDVMYDCLLFYREKAKAMERGLMKRFGIRSKNYYLATIHRVENTDKTDRLREILGGFTAISAVDCPVLLPLHPRTRKRIAESGLTPTPSNRLHIIEPVSYVEMLALESIAKVILTDSGGMQKEAYWFQVPCVTIRDETEWVETVELGWNVLVGAERTQIVEAVRMVSNGLPKIRQPLYGDGRTADNICKVLSG